MNRYGETALLNVETCSHGKTNDGGFTAVTEDSYFTFPACGRLHHATRDKYTVDSMWLEEQRVAAERRERLAKAREARKESARPSMSPNNAATAAVSAASIAVGLAL